MELNERDIQAFFVTTGALVAAAEKIDSERALYLGHRFNVFDTIQPDENRLSDILCDLLDPRGSHGQGDRFLRAFLGLCKIDEPWSSDTTVVRVYREASTTTLDRPRRIDLVIDYGNGAIAIENKPRADEQADQLSDYADHLRREYEERFHLVYLSGDGRAPKTLGGDWEERLKKRFHLMAYNSGGKATPGADAAPALREWADHCARIAEADKVRWFLRDLAAWIALNFKEFSSNEEER